MELLIAGCRQPIEACAGNEFIDLEFLATPQADYDIRCPLGHLIGRNTSIFGGLLACITAKISMPLAASISSATPALDAT